MIASETLYESQSRLSKLIAELDLDWTREVISEEKKLDEETIPAQYRFTTTVAGSKLYVTELHVGFSKPNQSEEGLFEDKRQIGDGLKKSNLYKKLVKRFDENDDISYYNGLYESINRLLEAEENEAEAEGKSDDRTIPLLDGRKGQ